MAEAIGSISERLTKFTCFEQLPLELQYRIAEQVYQNDLAECNGHLDVEITQDQPRIALVDNEAYVDPSAFDLPVHRPKQAPHLFALYAVNSMFKKELNRLSNGRLTFAFCPDFKARKCLDVVYFDPSEDKLRLHYLTGEPDVAKATGLLFNKIVRNATRVEVYCHQPNADDKPPNIAFEFAAYFTGSSTDTAIWSGIKKPMDWNDDIDFEFPKVLHTLACWWGVYAVSVNKQDYAEDGDDLQPVPCGHTVL